MKIFKEWLQNEELNSKYSIQRDGKTFGPFTLDQLKKLSETQKLQQNDLIRQEGESFWKKASEMSDLFPNKTFGGRMKEFGRNFLAAAKRFNDGEYDPVLEKPTGYQTWYQKQAQQVFGRKD